MKNNTLLLDAYKKEFDERMIEREKRDKMTNLIYQQNKDLIAYWNSIPRYQFWKRPSFEEQRSIIISNWNKL